MTRKIEDGGAAFPHQFEDVTGNKNWMQSQGMSLRDWFAGQALTGIMAGLCSDHTQNDTHRPRAWNRAAFDDCATDAYHIADAMIAARKAGAE